MRAMCPAHFILLDFITLIFGSVFMSSGARIAQWHSAGLRAVWSVVWVSVGAGNVSPHHRVQTGCGAHRASYTIDMIAGVQRPGCEADHSPLSSAKIKNAWSYTPVPQCAFMAWCSVKAKGQLYLYFFMSLSPAVSWEVVQLCHWNLMA
jgi:hypothetical protein